MIPQIQNPVLKISCLIAVFLFSANCWSRKLPYQNTKLTPEERAKDLLSRLTLNEKASLMQNQSPAIPRLGIKAYDWWNEALHGVGRSGLATVFPQSIGMAASFDDALLFNVFTAVSDEARAKSNKFSEQGGLKRYQGLTCWTPNVNIFRDPRWGRGQETYGEDPFLTSRMGVAVVKGLQGPDNAQYDKLHACAKHFAVHSGPEWNRHSYNADNISPRDLYETYLPAFKDLVQKANVKEVMCAYNRFEGEPCCGSNRLLTQILRNEWRYQGLVVSDCWAISDFYKKDAHATQPDAAHASADAVINGTDLECGVDFANLPDAVRKGLIDEKRIDVSLLRLLKARFELGEMNEKPVWDIPYSVVNSPEHQKLALKMTQESLVLLQNKNNLLPLNKALKIALVGPNANDSVMQWGNYNGFPAKTVTLLEGMRAYLGNDLLYDFACDRTSETTISSLFQECSVGGKRGFVAQYWNTRRPEGEPVVTEFIATPLKLTTMGATTFAAGVNIRNFSAHYNTVFKPTRSGDVAFRFQVNGRTSLTVNGELVLKNVFAQSPTNAYTLKAEAGKSYDIEISFSQGDKDAILDFDLGSIIPINISSSISKVKDADVVVFAGGIAPSLEGEEMPVTIPGFKGGDRTDIELPAIQRKLLQELKKSGKKVVLVNFSGSAMGLVPETESCDAILQAWYPGQAGGTAIATALFGDYNPSGKLPVTFYRNMNQLPDFEDYKMKGRTYRFMTEKPLFPFGYGLSYTNFEIGNATTDKTKMKTGETVKLAVPITNRGERPGTEVVQVYIRKMNDVEGPLKTLRGFQRVELAAGQAGQAVIELTPSAFEFFDWSQRKMAVVAGQYEILYGNSSDFSALKSLKMSIE
ncbi:MAG: glycoside hydrolase family 3 domain protein [Bacteroidetes bacterium]|nr:glycoside hydrolase family 3 domain protein [Bacteroidota bacterium]